MLRDLDPDRIGGRGVSQRAEETERLAIPQNMR